jgi:hypothetical protein
MHSVVLHILFRVPLHRGVCSGNHNHSHHKNLQHHKRHHYGSLLGLCVLIFEWRLARSLQSVVLCFVPTMSKYNNSDDYEHNNGRAKCKHRNNDIGSVLPTAVFHNSGRMASCL